MAGRFSIAMPGRRPMQPWFRLGSLDVTTTILALMVAVAGLVIYGASPRVLDSFVLRSSDFTSGEVWRAITWPIPNDPSLWIVLMLAIFWYFGTELESRIGRNAMAVFLLTVTVVPGVIAGVFDLAPDHQAILGFRVIHLCVLLLFIAEQPFARFFFGIPAWAIGAVIVFLEFVQLSGAGHYRGLVFRLLTFAIAAIVARSMGLLGKYPWIPALPAGRHVGGSEHPGRAKVPRSRARRQKRGRGSGDVVRGPWDAPRGGPVAQVGADLPQPPSPSDAAEAAADQAELDRLLDKISSAGMDGLTTPEKERLNELSKRMRKRR